MELATRPRPRTVAAALYDMLKEHGELGMDAIWRLMPKYARRLGGKKSLCTKRGLRKALYNNVHRGYLDYNQAKGTWRIADRATQKVRHRKETKVQVTTTATPNIVTLKRNDNGNFELRMTLSERSAQDMALSAISGDNVNMKIDRLEYEN